MKHRKIVISLLPVMLLLFAVGAVLNTIVVSANGGMPVIGSSTAVGRWIPINPGTKFVRLSDIIVVGSYALSAGDLFIIAGIVTSTIAVWIAMRKARKFFLLLIPNVIGIFISRSLPGNLIPTLLFTTAAVGTLLIMYRKERDMAV